MRKKSVLDYTPSVYQEDIFNFVEHGVGNAVISAYAGSGKTTTIVSCMKLIPKSQKCLFLAFNKSIVEALSEKVKNYSNCYVKTMHSLGYLMIRRNLGNDISIDEFKYKSYIKSNISTLSEIEDVNLTTSQVNEYIDSIINLVDFSRYNLLQGEEEIEKIAIKYNIPIAFDEVKVVKKVLKWGKENYKTIDYTDMVWLPNELALRPTGLQYDWIYADEVQDFSVAYAKLLVKCFKRGTRFIVVGDKKQSINVFAGASEEAFDYFCNYPNTKHFTLPITYRCPINIVEMAKEYVNDIQAKSNAIDGIIKNDCHIEEIKEGDMVLSRTKAPLVKLYSKLLRQGVTCYIKGSDIGINLIKMLENVDKELLNASMEKDGVFVRLFDSLFTERNNIMKKYGLSKDDATLTGVIMERYDSINSLLTLSERIKTKTKLIEHINRIFKEENDGIMLSTIHKAKGLEANNVYILCRSSMPSKLAHSTWEKQQEENLIYVAITRTKNILGFVSEKDIPPTGSSQDPSTILSELKMVENNVCKILGKTPMKEDDNIEISRMKVKSVDKIDEEILKTNQNTKVLKKSNKNENNKDEIIKKLSQYLDNGGDINALYDFMNNSKG